MCDSQDQRGRLWRVGDSVRRTAHVSAELVDRFVALSGDDNPLHVDSAFARAHGFRERVAHGALLASILSGVIGTELPGAGAVLQALELSFHNPCYAEDDVTVEITIAECHESVQTLACRVEMRNGDGLLLVKGRFRSGRAKAC
jgi:acyl dehydratase